MIWLIGNKGMLGSDVQAILDRNKLAYIASDMDVDITEYTSLERFAAGRNIKWIINCSAYTAVDKAEDEEDKAFKINSHGAENIAKIAGSINAPLIHISTDYVFNGEKEGAYVETDLTGPSSAYGRSKLSGEEKITNLIDKYFIIRTAWLYGINGNNFVYTMLKLFKERYEVRIVADQWGTPTHSKDLAEFIIKIITSGSRNYGIFHYTNEGRTNWFGFAEEIYKKALDLNIIAREIKLTPIKTEEYPTRAKRPKNSFLSKEKTRNTFNIDIPEWQESLEDFLKKVKNNESA